MRTTKFLIAAALSLAATAALADQGKIGAWKRTTETHISDPSGVLYQLPPAMVKQLHTTEGTVTGSYCMSAADVASASISFNRPSCTIGETSMSGQTMSADYTCSGDSPGRGTISITYDTPEHYTGDMLFVPKAGSKLKWKSAIEGQWIGASCVAN